MIVNAFSKPALVKKTVTFFSKDNNKNLNVLKKHMPAILGIYISGFYVFNTLCNNKIPNERKNTLAINSMFAGLVGAMGGYAVKPVMNKIMDGMLASIENEPNLKAKVSLKDGIKTVVPIFVFSFFFRYVAAVLATPASDKINSFWEDKKDELKNNPVDNASQLERIKNKALNVLS